MSESLRKRVITALVLVALFTAVLIWLPPVATVAVLTFLILAGAWEWSGFLRLSHRFMRVAYVALIAVLLPPIWYATATVEGRNVLLSVVMLWWIVALFWVIFAPRVVGRWSAGIAGLLTLVPAWLSLVRLRLVVPHGAAWVFFAFLLVAAADIGAYFTGRRFGRIRLAPEVSPGKTWEGVYGAVAVSAIVAVVCSLWFHVPLIAFLLVCMVAVLFSIVGDLTESLLKRFAGLKDSGTLFPGHGGVMDRIDSVTGAAPVLFLGLTLIGVIS